MASRQSAAPNVIKAAAQKSAHRLGFIKLMACQAVMKKWPHQMTRHCHSLASYTELRDTYITSVYYWFGVLLLCKQYECCHYVNRRKSFAGAKLHKCSVLLYITASCIHADAHLCIMQERNSLASGCEAVINPVQSRLGASWKASLARCCLLIHLNWTTLIYLLRD